MQVSEGNGKNVEWLQSRSKRRVDLLGGAVLAPLLAPPSIALAAMISTVDKFSPIYTSRRHGMSGTFNMYKFRTMPTDTPLVPSSGSSGDPRATRLGAQLRHYHLDEIPQLVNVLNGSMSLVGPRPTIDGDIAAVDAVVSPVVMAEWRQAKLFAKPGVTGLSQVKQHKANYSSKNQLTERVEADIEYYHTASLSVDGAIMLDSILANRPDVRSIVRGDDESGNHMALMMAQVAEGYGNVLEENQTDEWSLLLRTARAIDDLVDTDPSLDVQSMMERLYRAEENSCLDYEATTKFSHMFSRFDAPKKATITNAFMSLPGFVYERQRVRTVPGLQDINEREALVMSGMLHIEDDTEPATRFNAWLDAYVTIGYHVDSAVDLSVDHASGMNGVTPSVSNRARLLMGAFRHNAMRTGIDVPRNTRRHLAAQAMRTVLY